jgi:ankyrin repeat protein
MLKLLIAAGADLNIQNIAGETALFTQYEINNLKVLIEAGADMRIKNDRGEIFLDYTRVMLRDEYRKLATQELIFGKDPAMINDYIRLNIPVHPEMKDKYEFAIKGNELNLL